METARVSSTKRKSYLGPEIDFFFVAFLQFEFVLGLLLPLAVAKGALPFLGKLLVFDLALLHGHDTVRQPFAFFGPGLLHLFAGLFMPAARVYERLYMDKVVRPGMQSHLLRRDIGLCLQGKNNKGYRTW